MKQLGTKWQFNFLVALMTSWSAFDLFCKKQYNKKMLQQYIHKFFPRKKIKKIDISTKDYKRVIDFIKYGISQESAARHIDGLNIIINSNYLIDIFKKNLKDLNRNTRSNHILKIYIQFLNNNGDEINDRSCDITSGYADVCDGISSTLRQIVERASSYESKTIKIYGLYLESSRRGSYEVLKLFKKVIQDCYESKNIKNKSLKKNMNIGIEFEIESIDQTSITFEDMEKIVDQNIVSLSSGIDGNSDTEHMESKNNITDFSRKEELESERINEDRIRLNGYKGLKGLYNYISFAKKRSAISPSSSIHIHIDCDYDDSYKRLKSPSNKLIQEQLFLKYLRHSKELKILEVLDVETETKELFQIHKKIKKKDIKNSSVYNPIFKKLYRFNELKTIEFRTFKPTLEYEDVVCYILISSYFTKCFKQKTKIQEENVNKIINAWLYVKRKKQTL